MKLLMILLISLLAFPVAAQSYLQSYDINRQVEQKTIRIERQNRETQALHNKQGYRVYRGNPDQYHPMRDRTSRSYNGLDRSLRY